MQFIHGQDAIHEFQAKLRFLKNSHLYWCAVVLTWPHAEVAPWVGDTRVAVQMSQLVGKALALEADKAQMLALPSGDVVVLGDAVSNAAYKRMKLALEEMMLDVAKGVAVTCSSYDLSVDWDAFLETAREVYGRLGQIQTQTQQVDKSALLKRLDGQIAAAAGAFAARSVKPESLNLLFVEDEPTIRQLLNNLLGGSGHNLMFAANGVEAVEAYIRKPPHIAFLDINLPDISGLEVLEMIARHDKRAYAVMLTSSSVQAQVQSAVQQGVKGYIVKPFSRQKLVDCLERYYSV